MAPTHKNISWLLAESGSTKCDWQLFRGPTAVAAWSSAGFNLQVQGPAAVRQQLEAQVRPALGSQPVDYLVFYGPSLATADACTQMEALLRQVLAPNAQIEVAHDLLAAARACCGHEPGVVGILGTGSNACLYDGQHVVASRGGWGYLLGDEGSGADLGRRLLRAALAGELPAPDLAELEREWGAPTDTMARALYAHPQPHVRLAELAPYLIRRRNSLPYGALIRSSLRDYIELSFTSWPLVEGTAIHFVGSVAAELQAELAALLANYRWRLGRVLARPITELVNYHVQSHAFARD